MRTNGFVKSLHFCLVVGFLSIATSEQPMRATPPDGRKAIVIVAEDNKGMRHIRWTRSR